MDVLKERTRRKINGTGSSAPAGDVHVSGGVGDVQTNAGVDPARTLPIDAAPLAAGVLHGESPQALQVTPCSGGGASAQVCMAEPSSSPRPALEWDKPVRHPDGTGYVKSLCGGYSIVKENRFRIGTVYVVFRDKAILGASCRNLEEAKSLADLEAAKCPK